MTIDQAVTATPVAIGQNIQANNNPEASSDSNAGASSQAAVARAASNRDANNEASQNTGASSIPDVTGNGEKAVIGLDDNNNAIIIFVDQNGKTIRQFPPEDFLTEMKKLNRTTETLVSKKV